MKKLSIVFSARNDEHGGNLLKRLEYALNTNIYLLEKYNIFSEFVIVDYNTPENKKKLYEIIKILVPRKFVSLKFIIVPPYIHKRFKNYKKIPFHNMLARNIGIRRASGEFILSTGLEVIFSENIVKRFNFLEEDILYRATRFDVSSCILDIHFNPEKILKSCEKNIIDIHFNTNKDKIFYKNVPFLHTNACGDFHLAHREIWFNLRGYPEIDETGIHSDTIFNYMSYVAGYKEIVLDGKIFHIEHYSRWLKPIYTHILRCWRMLYYQIGEKAFEYKEDFYKLAKKVSSKLEEEPLKKLDINPISLEEAYNLIKSMIDSNNFRYNDKNWGIGEKDFQQIIF